MNKSIMNENELELGKFFESDMLELTKDEVAGGGTPTIILSAVGSFIVSFVSDNTCPTTACTEAC